jgi:hypothetical protein
MRGHRLASKMKNFASGCSGYNYLFIGGETRGLNLRNGVCPNERWAGKMPTIEAVSSASMQLGQGDQELRPFASLYFTASAPQHSRT